MNINEFERTKPTKTYKLITSLEKDLKKLADADESFKNLVSKVKQIKKSFLIGE